VTYRAAGQDRSANVRHPWLIDKIPVGARLTVYLDPRGLLTDDQGARG
jgi:hypothetical protein